MEHREPPRIVSAEGRPRDLVADETDPPPRRFPRLPTPPSVRRLKPHGIAVVAAAALAGVAALVLLVSAIYRNTIAAVHAQPDYQIDFLDLTLVPDPPAWYRGGRSAFLNRVREESRFPQTFSVLDLDLAKLRKAFQLDCWVDEVGQVRKTGRNSVVIPLKFREPVALARFNRDVGQAVDVNGVLLPRAEIDLDAAAPLIYLQNFDRPVDPRLGTQSTNRLSTPPFGIEWHTQKSGHDAPAPDPQVATAVRLAAFLRGKIRSLSAPGRELFEVYIQALSGNYWVQVRRDLFLWSGPSESAESKKLSDEEKWVMLLDCVQNRPSAPHKTASYVFTRNGVK